MRYKFSNICTDIRREMRHHTLARDGDVLASLRAHSSVTLAHRRSGQQQAIAWIAALREQKTAGLMDIFMAEYGLSNNEGIALMCLAEALLRVPDAETMDALIEDKIAPSNWAAHLGRSSSPLVNASTWALFLTGRLLDGGSIAGALHGAIRRVGEPVVRTAVKRAMRELGVQFVLGQNIDEAIANGKAERGRGNGFSYDMLGEAAHTAEDALEFFQAYADAITQLGRVASSTDIRENSGISIKLSALYERYELVQKANVMRVLVPRVLLLAQMAKKANIGLNIDAEEAARLDLSLDVIAAVLQDPSLQGWAGFGIVVQAYGKRARFVIDWFYHLAKSLDRKVMVRLVKGAYWDSEIKLAQVDGLEGFPVFVTKPATDVAYIEHAAHLLTLVDVIYPQFATHNAHTVAMVAHLAAGLTREDYEFQRLHGMGQGLYGLVQDSFDARLRIYAPVGVHEDLLAYLVRRLLENGANSSFVHQILDQNTPAAMVAQDPYDQLSDDLPAQICHPSALFAPRKNSQGWNLADSVDLDRLTQARAPFAETQWQVSSRLAVVSGVQPMVTISHPATGQPVGQAAFADQDDCVAAITATACWRAPIAERAQILRRAADIYEENIGEILAILAREAGKTLADGIAEIREAVDFLRFYADEAERYQAEPKGVIVCISPWNFPLAIFTGQIAAALAAGNGVLAKPAEATPIIAARAVDWLHEAGVPADVLQLLLGTGAVVGAALCQTPKVGGVCFTGSTATAQSIHRAMAEYLPPQASLIAETGGLNAMIVDSTALPEQAVRDIVISAFQSAGQRCSACRVLFLQADIADKMLKMLYGAMDALNIGDPWDIATDVGPVIDQRAKDTINAWVDQRRHWGSVLKQVSVPEQGHFVSPTVIELGSIDELQQEIFGPVLHVIRYAAEDLDDVISAINGMGYGLTFGLHSRIDDRVEKLCQSIRAGNIYINRNQIGAVVGAQPFGGEGLSGTGPKAGGPLYLQRFCGAYKTMEQPHSARLPGPTGESNLWSRIPRGKVLCLGPSADDAQRQASLAQAEGCTPILAPAMSPDAVRDHADIDLALYWGVEARAYRQALAARDGAIVPLVLVEDCAAYLWSERHVCVDTTASGGNAELLAV